ncbi:uncharacterized protein [Euwallacea similis]|uniref:uncharacterized protein n=1 Tax=Euwallacea similis TaxID=1736056 RepID=UPI00344B427D
MISEDNCVLHKNVMGIESPKNFWRRQFHMRNFDDKEKSDMPIQLEINKCQGLPETDKRVPLLLTDNPNTEGITCTSYRSRSYSESASSIIKNNLRNRKAISLSDISKQLIYTPLNASLPVDDTKIHVSKTAISETSQGDYKQELLNLLDAAADDLLKKPLKNNEKQPGYKAQLTSDQFSKIPRSMDTGSPDTRKLQDLKIVRKPLKKFSDVKIFPKKRKKIMVLESSEDEEKTRIDTLKKRRNKSVEKKKGNMKFNSSLSSRQRNFMDKKESKTGLKSHKYGIINFKVLSGKEKRISKGKTTKTMVEKKSAFNSSLSINVDKHETKKPSKKSVKGKRTSTGETIQLKPVVDTSLSIVEPQRKPARIKHSRSTYTFESDIDSSLNNIPQKYKKRFRDLFGEASDDDEITQLPKNTSSLKCEMVKNLSKRNIVTAKSDCEKPTKGAIKRPKEGKTFNIMKPKSLKGQMTSENTKEKPKQNSETNKQYLVKIGDKQDQRTIAKSQTTTTNKEQPKSVNQSNKILKKRRLNKEEQVAAQEISQLNSPTGENKHYFAAKTCTSLTTKPSIHQTFKLQPMLDKCTEQVNICDEPGKKNDSNVVQRDLDDVVEIVPPIPIINLTTTNYGEELKAPAEDCFSDMLLEPKREILESTGEEGIITMYRAQENVTAVEDVEAISASICVGYSTNSTFKEETASAQTSTLNESESSQIGAQCNNTLFRVFVNKSGENVEASISVPSLFKLHSNTLGIIDNLELHQAQVHESSIENTPKDPSLALCSKFALMKGKRDDTQMVSTCSLDASIARTQNVQGSGNNDTELKHLVGRSVEDCGVSTSVVSSIENNFCSSRVPSISAPRKEMSTLMSNSDRSGIDGSSDAALIFSMACRDEVTHNPAVTPTVCPKNSGIFSSINELQSNVYRTEVSSSGKHIDSCVEDQTYSFQTTDDSTLSYISPSVNNRGKSATVQDNEASKEVVPASISVDFTTEKIMQTLSSVAEKCSATSVSVSSTIEEEILNGASASIKEERRNTTCNGDNALVDTVNISISSEKVAPAASVSLNVALGETISCILSPTGPSQTSTLLPSIKEEPTDFVSLDTHAQDSGNVIQEQCGGNTAATMFSSSNLEVFPQNPSSSSIISNENVSVPKSTASTLICPYPLSSLIQTVAQSITSTEVREQIPRPSMMSSDIPSSNFPLQNSMMPSPSNLNRSDARESHSGADKSHSVSEEVAEGPMMFSLNDRMRIAEILSRHLYFLAQLCNVQNIYVETLIRAKFYKSYFKAEIAIFEAQTKTRLNSQSLQLFKELLLLNIRVSCNLSSIVPLIIHDITNNLATKDMPKPTTKALVCLLLRELLVPYGKAYAKIPLFKVMMQYCDDALERMYNNCVRSTPFTEQMRKTLMYQIQQYNMIIANSRAATQYNHGGANSLLKTNAEKQTVKRMHKYRNHYNLNQSNVMQPPAIQNRGIIPQNVAYPGGVNTSASGYTPVYVPQFQSRTQSHVYTQWLNFGNRGIPRFHLNPNITTENRSHIPSTSIQRSDTQPNLLKPRGNSLDNQTIFSKLLASSGGEPFAGTTHFGPPNNPSPRESAGNNGVINGVSPKSGPVLSPVRENIHWKKRATNTKEICKPCNVTNQLVQPNKAKADIISKAADGARASKQSNLPKTVENESPTGDTIRKDPTSIQFTRGVSRTTTTNTENHVNKEKVYAYQAPTEQYMCPEKRTSAIDGHSLNFKKRKLHEVADCLVVQNLDQQTAVQKTKPIALPSAKADQKFPVAHIDDPTAIGEISSNSTSIDSSSMENNIETIDLTWIDDIDTADLQKDIDFVFVKQENEENSVMQDCSGAEEETTITIVHRMCLCGVIANYNCACGDAWYCGENCQLKDWVSHEKVCHAVDVQES